VASPPTGTVTFLFTDIEGSTKMWERSPHAMHRALSRHDEILREAIEEHGGYVFKTVGDAFCCAFLTAPDALESALEAQRSLLKERWAESDPLRVRMALHMGVAEERDGDYFGPPVNRVARLLSAAHGGQVLLSLPAQELVRDQLPAGTSLMDLGERRLKDLFRPERVFQLLAPGLPSEFPPLRTLEAYRNNLPLQPTPLIGREKEVSEVCDLLRGEVTRLLTLTGPGGTGKTRVALQVAADLLEDFPDGAFFAQLATVSEAELFLPAVAETLGVREIGEQPLEETLKDYLSERRLLLLLDNFEQVLGSAPTVTEMLAGAHDLKVLVTSRTPLRLYGEKEYAVPPLSVPDVKHLPDLKALSQYEAVRLFIERSKSAKADFEVTDESAPAVAEICVRLDGLPLAIELAAARIKMLPPKAMLQRLTSRLKLLTGGARDLPERQRTLRATIEWSFALLDEGERVLFGRLAVFSGGRTLEAIEAICDAEGDLPADAFEGVSSLLDKSLLRQEEGPNEEPRFVMLETVHEFAREKLEESSEAEQIKHAHAQYFLALAEKAVPELMGANQLEWLERLEIEHDNVRAALSWMLERGETELALQLGAAFSWFWEWRSYYAEGRRWLEEALRMDSQAPAATRANALAMAGNLAERQGDYDRSVELCEEGLELLRQTEEGGEGKLYLLIVLIALANAVGSRGDSERARELYEEGLALSQEEGQEWFTCLFLHNLALLSSSQGDHERAIELLEQSAAIARRLGDQTLSSYHLMNLGNEYLSTGDHERAATLLEESLASFRVLGARGEVAWSLGSLGWAALLRKDFEQAETLYQESLALNRELGRKPDSASCLEDLACVASARGEAMRAAQLWGAAEALHQATGYPQDPISLAEMEPYLASARSQIHETVWAKAWEEGQAMTLEEAISYALEEHGRGSVGGGVAQRSGDDPR
jgi:predicted ATPase/class 3 adenylate cyclase/Tfp pilus assembly protein PilF